MRLIVKQIVCLTISQRSPACRSVVELIPLHSIKNIVSIRRFDPKPHWSCAVSAGPLLFLSGQTAYGAESCTDLETQTVEVLRRIDDILAANQSGKAYLVSVTVYLRHIDDLPRLNKVWAEWLDGYFPPARATVQAALAHSHLLVEMSVVAMAESLPQDAAQ